MIKQNLSQLKICKLPVHDTFANKHRFNQPHAKEVSHTILFAYALKFTKDKFRKRADAEVSSDHLPAEMYDNFIGAYAFADENGFHGSWTTCTG